MSHGSGGGEGIRSDPNLTPLLDVVLQLLMFFMMCVNFVNEQVNEHIRLPFAQSARPMERSDDSDVLFLNVNSEGNVEVVGQSEPLTTKPAITYYLKQQYEDTLRRQRIRDEKQQIRTAVIIRADRAASYGRLYEIMRACKEVGYRKLQIRAMTKAE